jgi:molybdopterin/thiamine biosynthesis adenylyltransferase
MSLDHFYKEKIEQANWYLASRYRLEECTAEDPDYPSVLKSYSNIAVVWKIKIGCTARPLTLIVAFPSIFPDALPKIYLSKKDFAEIFPIPHLDSNRFICTRDPEVVFIREDSVNEGVQELIDVAIQTVMDGLQGMNSDDFVEEFLAYWNDGAMNMKALSLFAPSDRISRLKLVRLSKKVRGYADLIIAKTSEQATRWLKNLGVDIAGLVAEEAVYLPLPKPFETLPESNRDILEMISNAGEGYSKALQDFFNERDSHLFVIFSVPLEEGRVMAGWKHSEWSEEIQKGFRLHHIPLEVRLNKTGQTSIQRLAVERVDRERLFSRGGTGLKHRLRDASVAIVGCGSIGSPLAVSLSQSGILKFLLVDKERLESENVPRHVCGFSEVGLRKSIALKDAIAAHLPYVECDSRCEDVLELLKEDSSILNRFDLVVMATGSFPVERRLNTLLRSGIITSPVVYTWIEPYGVAGHILYLHPEQGGCYLCCFDNDKFRFSVISNQQRFYKRESGCQSTFLPYSNLEVDHFVTVASKIISHFLEDNPDRTLLYTWLGDIEAFEKMGYRIEARWAANRSYSVHKTTIERNHNCPVCQGK